MDGIVLSYFPIPYIHLADIIAQSFHFSLIHSCSCLSGSQLLSPSHPFPPRAAFGNHQREGDKGVVGYTFRAVHIIKDAVACHKP